MADAKEVPAATPKIAGMLDTPSVKGGIIVERWKRCVCLVNFVDIIEESVDVCG